MQVDILKQSEFPLLDKYKKVFPITKDTIFAYDNKIYSNNNLPPHLVVHELEHHKQQEEWGLDNWVNGYLKSPDFRLAMEIEAYVSQLKSIKDRNERAKVWMESAKNLSSELYGNLIDYKKALELLRIN